MASVDRIATCGWLMIGHRQHAARRAVVGDRERAAADLVGAQLATAGPPGEIVDLAGDRPQALALGGAYNRDEQALVVEIDGDADVDEVVHDEILVGRRSR